MEITYESICKKLGFDVDTYKPVVSDYEDDSKISPFSILTDEESDFLFYYFKSKRLEKSNFNRPE